METRPDSRAHDPGAARPPLRLLLVPAAVIVVIDQLTKVLAVERLQPGETTPVIDGVLHWTLQRNPGAAFGIFQRFPVVFTILAFAIAIGILAFARRIPDRFHAIALALVLGGALGNLADRLVRTPGAFRGHVVDFIDLRVWPVFNVADSAVVVGAVLLAVGSWLAERRTKRQGAPDD